MSEQTGCKHCEPFGWDDKRIWYKKIGRAFGISPKGLAWLNFLAIFALSWWFIRLANEKGTELSVSEHIFVTFLLSLFLTVMSLLVWNLPTMLRRFFIGKRQCIFILDDDVHIHRSPIFEVRALDRTLVPLLDKAPPEHCYLSIRFGLFQSNGIYYGAGLKRMKLGRTKGYEVAVVNFQIRISGHKLPFWIPPTEALRAAQQRINAYELVTLGIGYQGLKRENSSLESRIEGLSSKGFVGEVRRYLTAVISDLRNSRKAQRSQVAGQARQMLERAMTRLRLAEAHDGVNETIAELKSDPEASSVGQGEAMTQVSTAAHV